MLNFEEPEGITDRNVLKPDRNLNYTYMQSSMLKPKQKTDTGHGMWRVPKPEKHRETGARGQNFLENRRAQVVSNNAQPVLDNAQVRLINAQLRSKHAQTRLNDAQVRSDDAQFRLNGAQARSKHAQARSNRAQARSIDAQTILFDAQTRSEHAQARSNDAHVRYKLAQVVQNDGNPLQKPFKRRISMVYIKNANRPAYLSGLNHTNLNLKNK